MTTEGFIEFCGYKLWYHIAEPAMSGSAAPLLLLHGGPGGSSDILEPLDEMADQGTTVIRFDQLGCGRSERPRDPSLWTLPSCVEQLDAVREALGLERVHLLGHSWGSMILSEYLLTRPSGVLSACFASAVVSSQLWGAETLRLRSLMPGHLTRAMERCERSYRPRKPPEQGAEPAPSLSEEQIVIQAKRMRRLLPLMAHPLSARLASWLSYVPPLRPAAYGILNIQFALKHVCRLQPVPLGICKMLVGTNGELFEVVWGPSEFFATGLAKEWDIRPRLSEIRLPTMILSGLYDEATPEQMAILKEGITGSEQIILNESSHCGMWEEPEKFRTAVLDFINRVESANV